MPHRWRSGAMGCGVRHAGCGVCAPAARGRDREREDRAESRERRQRGGQSSRLPREDDPSWYGYGCFPVQRGDLPQRHAPSRRLRHRPRAHHRLLPRHRQRQRMLRVPERHQPRRSLIKAVLRGGLFVASPRAPSVGYICPSFEKAVSGANPTSRAHEGAHLIGGKKKKD